MSKPSVPHYTQSTIDTWDLMSDWFSPEEYHAYLTGNVLKYLQRYRYKGTPVEDLGKAWDYLSELLESVQAEDRRRAIEEAGDLDPPF